MKRCQKLREGVEHYTAQTEAPQAQMREAAKNGKNKWIQLRRRISICMCRTWKVQQYPKHWRNRKRKSGEDGEEPTFNFLGLGKLSKYFRRVVPTKWHKLHETMMTKYKQQVENMREFLAKVSLRQGTLSWTREQHRKAHEQGVVRATATVLQGTEEDEFGGLPQNEGDILSEPRKMKAYKKHQRIAR